MNSKTHDLLIEGILYVILRTVFEFSEKESKELMKDSKLLAIIDESMKGVL